MAGQARGHRLQVPPGRATRPTSDRVREAIFSMLDSLGAIEAATVADLFAGSGALGIEALSRGASSATFVEQERSALTAIRANLAATGLADRATVVGQDAMRWLADPRRVHLDLVLCDPPYSFSQWPDLLERLHALTALAVLETGAEVDPGQGWEILRARRYGGTVVTVARPAIHPANRKGDT